MKIRGSEYQLCWLHHPNRVLGGCMGTQFYHAKNSIRKGRKKNLSISPMKAEVRSKSKLKPHGRTTVTNKLQSEWRLSMFGSIWQRKTDLLHNKRRKR